MPQAELSAIVVSYRSAPLALAFLEELKADARRAGLALERIAVVNSGDPAEAAALEPFADSVFLPDRNLGYAGGLNLGASAARGGTLLFANPDLSLRPGSLAPLAAAARGDLVAAGPVFTLDAGGTLLVPPLDEPHPFALARRRLARDPGRARPLLKRDLRRAIDMEEAARSGGLLELPALPGALLAASRETFDRVGPFDEAYPLYFEENDWERRLRRLGGRLLVAGASRVVHRYGRTTRGEPRAAAWFAESEARYYSSHFGRWGERALAAASSAAARPFREPPPLPDATLRWTPRDADAAVLVSPHPEMRPFAFTRPEKGTARWTAPGDFLADTAPGERWYARAVALPSGETLAEGSLRPEAAA